MEQDDIVAGWSERIRRATERQEPLRIRGGGTKDWYGQTLQGELLDTRALRGIIAYDPAELVITVKAGMKNNQLVVSSKLVKEPVAVRYGFANTAVGNIFGKEGLPVNPFRTDTW